MGPKTFVECYVCLKEFGAQSILFHEPICLKRWRVSNQNLPADKRASTPVKKAGWKYSQISFWICSQCQLSVPFAKKNQHSSSCSVKKLQSKNHFRKKDRMTGVAKYEFSPKRGKENKNLSNHIPTLSVVKKNVKNEAMSTTKDTNVLENNVKRDIKNQQGNETVTKSESSDVSNNSTSKRSLRPQTKILRRPTPNLKHPVIQVDSDDSSGDSSCSDKSKEDNPKRLKMGSESVDGTPKPKNFIMGSESIDGTPKPKNFIMYNKYNVEKNTKNASKDRTSAVVASSIPNPCNSCSRSQHPERLHSHAKKDARGLMNRRSPSFDVKMTSPQKKLPETLEKLKPRSKEAKTIISPDCAKKHAVASVKELQSDIKENISKSSSATCLSETVTKSSTNEKSILEHVKPCYICEVEVKISSLLLHESKCLENWKKNNNSLTPNLRKLPPRRPEEDEIPDLDEADPAWTAVQSQLIPCPLCGRTFFPERLPVHRRVCKGKPSPRALKRASSMREPSASSRNGEDQKPAAIYVPCYICNRNYGSWVISMHEQQCLRKWRRTNDKLPSEQQEKEPQRTTGSTPDDDVDSLIELGDNAWESHLQQLVPCPLCSRTFFPNRLSVHKRSCKGISNGTRPRSNKAA